MAWVGSVQPDPQPRSQSSSAISDVTSPVGNRADKGWAVKRARPSKKVWCSGLGLYLEMSPVFDFGQGLWCGLSIRHCRCHWIMAAWFVFLHFFFVPLCWYAFSKREMLLLFAGGFPLSWSRQTSLSQGFSDYVHDSTTELHFRSTTPNSPMSMLFQNKNN